MIFILYILRVIYALSTGFKDSILWSLKGTNSLKWDEHILFIVERGAITLTILLILFGWQFGWVTATNVLVAEICYILAFPFFQAGMYYQGRKWIDGAYPKGFLDDSTTSSAKLNFSFKARLILLIISLLILISYATIIN